MPIRIVPEVHAREWSGRYDIKAKTRRPISFGQYDCVVIVTDHKAFDYDAMVAEADLIVDTRNAIKKPPRTSSSSARRTLWSDRTRRRRLTGAGTTPREPWKLVLGVGPVRPVCLCGISRSSWLSGRRSPRVRIAKRLAGS